MGDLRYDPEVDAAYLTVGGPIADGAVARTIPIALPADARGELFLDLDADGRLLGIEILAASLILRPEAIG